LNHAPQLRAVKCCELLIEHKVLKHTPTFVRLTTDSLFVVQKGDVNNRDQDGLTPFHEAAEFCISIHSHRSFMSWDSHARVSQ
jgi:hypothetical protein